MPPETLTVIADGLTGDGPLDTASSRAILMAVSDGAMGETLEIAVPHRVLAFGKHDTSATGFDSAVESAMSHAFEPTVRIAGGRAAVFHEATIRFGWTVPVDDPATSMHARFARLAEAVVDALASFGITGTVGEVPGEYCPGKYSVHINGRKVMGVGQRLTRSAAYVGGVVVIDDADAINGVLRPVYRHLDIPFDPSTTGALSDVRPVAAEDLSQTLVRSIAGSKTVAFDDVPDDVRAAARELRSDHDPAPLA